jgi:hypothetical protein
MGRQDGIFGDDDDDGVFGPQSDDVGASRDATWQRLETSPEVPRTRDSVYLRHWDNDLSVKQPTDLSLLDRDLASQRSAPRVAQKSSFRPGGPPKIVTIGDMLKAHRDFTGIQVKRCQPQTWKGQQVAGFLATYDHPIDADFIKKHHGGGVYDVTVRGPSPKGTGRNVFLDSMRVKISGDPLLLTDAKKEEDENKMPFSRKISRVEFLEGLHRFLSTAELEDHNDARRPFFTKQQLLRHFIDIDNTISSISLENRWQEYIQGFQWSVGVSTWRTNEAVLNNDVDRTLWEITNQLAQAKNLDEQEAQGLIAEPETQLVSTPTDPVLLQAIESVASELRMTREQMPYQPDQWQLAQRRMEDEQRARELLEAINNVGGNISQLNSQMGDIYHGLDALVQYQLEAQRMKELAAREAATNPERMTMAERIKNAALETGTGVVSAFQEGLKISGSQRLSKKVVSVFHSKLGQHIPGAETAVGQKVEQLMIPALVHFMSSAFSDKVPKADLVQRTCLRAITGEAKDSGDELLDLFLPVFGEIASMDSMTDLASQFAQEDTPEMAEKSSAQSLSESIAGQLDGLQDGDKVEITVKRSSDQKVAAEADE